MDALFILQCTLLSGCFVYTTVYTLISCGGVILQVCDVDSGEIYFLCVTFLST